MELPNQLINFITEQSKIPIEENIFGIHCVDIAQFGTRQYNRQNDYFSQPSGWHIFATNNMDDAFFVNFADNEIDFPVYFMYHDREGKPFKVADSLKHFERIIKTINDKADDFPLDLNSLNLGVDMENEFWEEMNEYFTEAENFEDFPLDDEYTDITKWRLDIISIGDNKTATMALLRKRYNVPITELKELMAKLPLHVATGLQKELLVLKEAYEKAGCVMEMREKN